MTIGRGSDNALCIDESFISRKHVCLTLREKGILVRDLDSKNGTFVNNKRITEHFVGLNESFSLYGMEFYLKEGSADEFQAAEEIKPIFSNIRKKNVAAIKHQATATGTDPLPALLEKSVKLSLGSPTFNEFLTAISCYFSEFFTHGSLILLSPAHYTIPINIANSRIPDLFSQLSRLTLPREHFTPVLRQLPDNTAYYVCAFADKDRDKALLFFPEPGLREDRSVQQFLIALAHLFRMTLSLYQENDSTWQLGKAEKKGVHIVTDDEKMRNLIQKAGKIARSDIFVLIQGESGSGKELFAKLIHQQSDRSRGKLVALSCAAIPETLLENELFGHEKGAFTGAESAQQGKMELASGGTLVLDEIGDMPLTLQPKLLRAIQENEIYRIGATKATPIDLRIISMSNLNIEQLVAEKKFRHDLFYRLVHYTLTIPSLRERPKDIVPLINHFIAHFSRESGKSIRGLSVKAFNALKRYDWPGNVRQLEHEIGCLVNLTDDGELISYDLLSDRVKQTSRPVPTHTAANGRETDKERIIRLLESNDWNKSKTARDLNMTYVGLHKKMKRLGITRKKAKK